MFIEATYLFLHQTPPYSATKSHIKIANLFFQGVIVQSDWPGCKENRSFGNRVSACGTLPFLSFSSLAGVQGAKPLLILRGCSMLSPRKKDFFQEEPPPSKHLLAWNETTNIFRFGMSLEPQRKQTFWQYVLGKLPGYPGCARKVREQKVCVQSLAPMKTWL